MRFLTALFLAFLLLAAVLPAGVPAPAAEARMLPQAGGLPSNSFSTARVPVILIHGLGGGPSVTWGAPPEIAGSPAGAPWGAGGRGTGLFAYLEERGYVPGRTLFLLDYSRNPDRDYVQVATEDLASLVARVLQSTGATRVDLVGHGAGALAARYYASHPASGDAVRTVIMVAPPNHGSMTASILRLIGEVDRQERWRRHQGVYRSQESVVHDVADVSTPFDFVAARSRGFYEPLYGRYLEDGFLGDPLGKPLLESFESWFIQRFPGEYQRAFVLGQEPLETTGALPPVPSQAQSLSRAYFEYLAMKTAANNYGRLIPLAESLGGQLIEDIELHADWKTTLINFAVRRAARLLRQVVVPWLSGEARAAAVDRSELFWGVEWTGPGLSRLVSEKLALVSRSGYSAEGHGSLFLANVFLNRWNRGDSTGRRSSGPRYVTIAGRTVNVWRLLAPGTGDNDLVVEVDATLLPFYDNDEFRLVSGSWGEVHGNLVHAKRIWSLVADALGGWITVQREHRISPGATWPLPGQSVARGAGQAVAGLPYYVLFSAPREGAPGVGLKIALESPRPLGTGQDLTAWVYLRPAGMAAGEKQFGPIGPDNLERRPISLVKVGDRLRGEITIPGFPSQYAEVYLGLRLVREDGEAWKAEELLQRPALVFQYEARPQTALDISGGTDGSVQSEGTEIPEQSEGTEAPGERPQAGEIVIAKPNPVPEDDRSGGLVVKGELPPGWSPPLIKVIRKSKMTTRKAERVVHHQRWEVDFGDGTTWSETGTGGALQEIEHRFSGPGLYHVTARSLGPEGRLLRQQTWEVNLAEAEGADGAEGLIRRFPLAGPAPPGVELAVEGPRSWLTGRPAEFQVVARVTPPPAAEKVTVTYYPGETFRVQWEKPGRFRVIGAVGLKINYVFPDGRVTLYNTYTAETEVEVLATTVTD